MVKIRLSRVGRKNQPSYRVVITNAREKRESHFIEEIGYFDPIRKVFEIKKDRAEYWLSVGAQPTATVKSNFIRQGLIEKPSYVKKYTKPQGKKAQERNKTEEAA